MKQRMFKYFRVLLGVGMVFLYAIAPSTAAADSIQLGGTEEKK